MQKRIKTIVYWLEMPHLQVKEISHSILRHQRATAFVDKNSIMGGSATTNQMSWARIIPVYIIKRTVGSPLKTDQVLSSQPAMTILFLNPLQTIVDVL
mmetsp:Transcript_19929/g.35046  ORF Transcript_19929/g.35046 Transcript_19929/m.35046 type:complete len:98 (+) Transcript_19929:287-580(+)